MTDQICTYCYQPGHSSSFCPNLPPKMTPVTDLTFALHSVINAARRHGNQEVALLYLPESDNYPWLLMAVNEYKNIPLGEVDGLFTSRQPTIDLAIKDILKQMNETPVGVVE